MAGVVITMSADEAKLWRAQQKLITQQKEMSKEYGKVRKEALDAGAAGTKSFGSSGVKQLRNYAIGVFSIRTALQKATESFAQMNAQADKSLSLLDRVQNAQTELITVSNSSADFREMEHEIKAVGLAVGVAREELTGLRFAARSAGQDASFRAVAEAAEVIGVESAKGAAFKGAATLGVNSAEALALTFAGARSAPTFGPAQLGAAIPQAAQFAGESKTSAAELVAALTVISNNLKSPDQGAERINEFLAKVTISEGSQEMGTRGIGLLKAVEKLSAMSEEDRRKVLGGDIGSNATLLALTDNLEQIRSLQAELVDAQRNAGTEAGPVAFQRAVMMQQASLREKRDRIIEENLRSFNGERQAIERSEINQMLSRDQSTLIGEGKFGFAGFKGMLQSWGQGLGMDRLIMNKDARRRIAQEQAAADAAEQSRAAMAAAAKAQRELTDATRKATDAMRSVPSPPAARAKQQQAAGVE